MRLAPTIHGQAFQPTRAGGQDQGGLAAGRPWEESEASTDLLRFQGLVINPRTRTVEVNGRSPSLTAKEFDLLHHLASHPGQVFSREQLMNSVWDYTFAGDFSTVTVHVRRLREKIEPDPLRPRYVKTVWGVGYKFER